MSTIERYETIGEYKGYNRNIFRNDFLKRSFDIAFSLASLIFFSPFFVLISLSLVFIDGWPVFYRHRRVGRDGRFFDCLKFRTMRRDSDKVLAELLAGDAAARLEWDATQKLRSDPRVHLLGRFLRTSSLDELPQFINVLRGEMSIVGPRPIVEAELDRYGDRAQYYLSMTPGITGLWQVSGRNDTSYETRVDLDTEYCHTRSLYLDLKIVWRTVGVFLFERNGC